MRPTTPRAVPLVLLSAALLHATWSLVVPPGALKEEVAHYIAAGRARGGTPAMNRLVPKDLAVLAPFARIQAGRLPVRNAREQRKLEADLAAVTELVYVQADVDAPRASAYHAILHRALRLLQPVDTRWRWMIMRALGILGMAAAGALTWAALRSARPHDPRAGIVGAAVVVFGPAAGWAAALLGPAPLVAALWAAWAWAVARLGAGESWSAAWAALIGLAMSAVDAQGAAACVATMVAVWLSWARQRDRAARVSRVLAVSLGVLGIGLWVFRFATVGVPSASLSWRGYLAGAPEELAAMPGLLVAAWVAVGAGIVAAALALKPARAAAPLAAAAIVAAVTARLLPTSGAPAACIAPLVACLVAGGAARVLRSTGIAILLVILMGLNWIALLAWVVPGLYQ